MRTDRAELWRRQAMHHTVESTPEPCMDCGIEVIKCDGCGQPVKVYDVVDIFHLGWCEDCGVYSDEPCYPRGVVG